MLPIVCRIELLVSDLLKQTFPEMLSGTSGQKKATNSLVILLQLHLMWPWSKVKTTAQPLCRVQVVASDVRLVTEEEQLGRVRTMPRVRVASESRTRLRETLPSPWTNISLLQHFLSFGLCIPSPAWRIVCAILHLMCTSSALIIYLKSPVDCSLLV